MPPKEEYVKITIRVEKNSFETLQRYCGKAGHNLAIRTLIKKAARRLEERASRLGAMTPEEGSKIAVGDEE